MSNINNNKGSMSKKGKLIIGGSALSLAVIIGGFFLMNGETAPTNATMNVDQALKVNKNEGQIGVDQSEELKEIDNERRQREEQKAKDSYGSNTGGLDPTATVISLKPGETAQSRLASTCEEGVYNEDGFDCNGFDKDGFNADGFNANGCDAYGFDELGNACKENKTSAINGLLLSDEEEACLKDLLSGCGTKSSSNDYDEYGFDSSGFDRQGYDKRGYDRQGFNKDGFNDEGLDRQKIDKDGTECPRYDENGLDPEGYDENGFNASGLNRAGFALNSPQGSPNLFKPLISQPNLLYPSALNPFASKPYLSNPKRSKPAALYPFLSKPSSSKPSAP